RRRRARKDGACQYARACSERRLVGIARGVGTFKPRQIALRRARPFRFWDRLRSQRSEQFVGDAGLYLKRQIANMFARRILLKPVAAASPMLRSKRVILIPRARSCLAIGVFVPWTSRDRRPLHGRFIYRSPGRGHTPAVLLG